MGHVESRQMFEDPRRLSPGVFRINGKRLVELSQPGSRTFRVGRFEFSPIYQNLRGDEPRGSKPLTRIVRGHLT
jgi:hypothetical protein